MSVFLALLAATCNALSSVLQRKANKAQAPSRPFGFGLLGSLLRNPNWLLGVAAMIVSFLLQASALSLGTLSSVEPILVLELPLALLLGAIVLSQPLRREDWLASVVMAVGLGLLIGALGPSGGDASRVSLPRSVLATVATVGLVVVLTVSGMLASGAAGAVLFGSAAGAGFGLTAGLMKLAVARLSAGGVGALFSAWPTYGLVVAGIASVTLVQAAFHVGTLVAAQPGITLLDPLVSILWGAVVVNETTRTGPILLLAAAGAALIAFAAIRLAEAAWRAQEGTY